MPPRHGAGLSSVTFMGLSLIGVMFGYWTILKHTSLVMGAFAFAVGNAQAPLADVPEALNPKLTNIVENDTITLYYNGSGPVPEYGKLSPIPEPITPLKTHLIEDAILTELVSIVNSTAYPTNCSKCTAALQLLHVTAITQEVSTFTDILIRACNALPFIRAEVRASSCESGLSGAGGLGPYLAQLLSKMSLATGDMQMMCSRKQLCDQPPPLEIDESLYFSPKPESAEFSPEPSGHTIDVLHLSDWHLDPRYDIGSEGNCTNNYLCCRPHSSNTELFTNARNASVPASRFGSFFCDTPADLALSAFSDMPDFFNKDELAFSIFTGDIVSHDRFDELSRAYVSYEEEVTFRIFKAMLGDKTPMYVTLGNHDSLPAAFNTPDSMNPDPKHAASNLMAWNYELVSSLWHKYNWLNKSEAEFARTHYGAYAATTAQGLRIISVNSDFWYKENVFNYWNVTNPDPTGMLKWVADELSGCEARGQRAWIIAHVLTGYDGTAPMLTPTALFYSIVRRFAPGTLAAVFFGHTHQDQLQIFYDYLPSSVRVAADGRTLRDTTRVDYAKPLVVSHVGPSLTPLTGLNAGYRVYQVDAATFSVMDMQTYFANISNSLVWHRPVWEFEYDARTAYARTTDDEEEASGDGNDDKGVPWPRGAPLNATFWHRVTESMLHDDTLLSRYLAFETKQSASELHRGSGEAVSAEQKVCFLRSGSGALGLACRRLYGGGGRSKRDVAFDLV